MAKNKQTRKSRNFMYEQQVAHLPNNMTMDEMYSHVEDTLKPKRIACILHDMDKKDDNKTPAEPHIHMMLQFDNARSVNHVADEIGDNPQQLEIWKGNVGNGFSYLIHATDNSRHKHQYSCDEVRANFDYPALIANISKKVSKVVSISNAHKINGILDLVATGEMSFAEAKNQMSGSDFAKAGDKLKKAHELYLERSAEALHKQMSLNKEVVNVHWFYGSSETGKSFLAEKLASEMGVPFYKTTTTTDVFNFYQGENILILNELRPEVIPFSELLAILDPFSRGKVAVSSRYCNKALSCKTVFITTPYDPCAFYHGYRMRQIDSGEQLYRRLATCIKFELDYIYKMEYNPQFHEYTPVDKKPNHYSKQNQAPYTLNNIFDSIN